MPTPTLEEVMATLKPNVLSSSSKFVTKLTFEQRCSALAAVLAGVNPRVVAVAFGVHRATVSAMRNRSSQHYRDIRRELDMLGKDAFLTKYFTMEVAAECNAAQSDPEALLTDDDMRERRASHPTVANPNATKYAGTHKVYTHRFKAAAEIRIHWEAAPPADDTEGRSGAPGWFFSMADAETYPDYQCMGSDKTAFTSKQAFDAARVEFIIEEE